METGQIIRPFLDKLLPKELPISGISKFMLTSAEMRGQRLCEVHFQIQQNLKVICTKLFDHRSKFGKNLYAIGPSFIPQYLSH